MNRLLLILSKINLNSLGLTWVICAILGYAVGSIYAFQLVLPNYLWFVVTPLLVCLYLPLAIWFIYLAMKEFYFKSSKYDT